jgi:hypothetical protein
VEKWCASPRPKALAPLEELGRAKRATCATGELWWIESHVRIEDDERIARRLLALGAENVAGFSEGGRDECGVWIVRAKINATLDSLAKKERWDSTRALSITRDLARALAACERAAIFPGALDASEAAYENDHGWLIASHLVRSWMGAPATRAASARVRDLPPEQANGAAWDNAANRYALGLAFYRMIAGEPAFAREGLRRAIGREEAAPFAADVARSLRPGVQSFALSLIDPDPKKRPTNAAAIVTRCGEVFGESFSPPSSKRAPIAYDVAPETRARTSAIAIERRPSRNIARPLAAILVASALALAFAIHLRPATTSTPPIRIRDATPLTSMHASDCAPCHARQVAEWQRSVMAHAAKSPLFGALESAVEEQVGKSESCPNGAGILRKTSSDACRDPESGFAISGSGGEHWCVSCHASGENFGRGAMPPWSAISDARAREPMVDLLKRSSLAMEGVSCATCHATIGPVSSHANARGSYEGNATWTSFLTGATFLSRPEDNAGVRGIGNSGYLLDRAIFVGDPRSHRAGDLALHRRSPSSTSHYLASSEFCGACHDVRLFGSDVIASRERGEHFKRLRNAYSEWRAWANDEERAGRVASTCQDCHMSLYPGVCVDGGDGGDGCPRGSHFEKRSPGERADGFVASGSNARSRVSTHYFTSVDVPLTPSFDESFASDDRRDENDLPLGVRQRRALLLAATFRFAIGHASRSGARLQVPIEIENIGAGHRAPAGFSQEREIWVELTVSDSRGDLIYQVGKVDRGDEDLHDKIFLRVTTRDDRTDTNGRPLGVFGADVIDGPDVPTWSPNPARGGSRFVGRGLINFQNGFLRCVRCIGVIDAEGRCEAGIGQGRTRADRFADGDYDIDTGECRSNLSGGNELFETYFPLGSLDADRGIVKAPDAIVDTRSAPPNVPLSYTYDLNTGSHPPPFHIAARLRFRAFPPFLVRAFAAYESAKSIEGKRPSGPQVTNAMLDRIDVVDLKRATTDAP